MAKENLPEIKELFTFGNLIVADESLPAEDVLNVFATGAWNGHCLAHLFTHRDHEGMLRGF